MRDDDSHARPTTMSDRFLIFAGHEYYPGGGWNDHQGTTATEEAAHASALALLEDGMSWAHYVDTETGEMTRVRAPDDGPTTTEEEVEELQEELLDAIKGTTRGVRRDP